MTSWSHETDFLEPRPSAMASLLVLCSLRKHLAIHGDSLISKFTLFYLASLLSTLPDMLLQESERAVLPLFVSPKVTKKGGENGQYFPELVQICTLHRLRNVTISQASLVETQE